MNDHTKEERGWARRQVEEARKSMAQWPDWMKRACYFAGNPEMYEVRKL